MTTFEPAAAVEHRVATRKGDLHVEDRPGAEPAIVLMHGFPDDSRIYRHLLPELAGRRAVTFDFLGYGRSGRDAVRPLEAGQREEELAAVVAALELDRPVLVGHDASGPVVVNYALAHPDRVSRLVLMNTFFGNAPTLQFPELIRLLADAHFTPLADAFFADPTILGWILLYTDQRLNQAPFDPDGVGAKAILPQFVGDGAQPDAVAAIRAWTGELFADMALQDARIAAGDLGRLDVPVTLAFGARDPYLNPGVAHHLQSLFAKADLHEIADAAHWPQWDQPAAVAPLITG